MNNLSCEKIAKILLIVLFVAGFISYIKEDVKFNNYLKTSILGMESEVNGEEEAESTPVFITNENID